eukprot:COSAG01_NODE_616_length_14815_cov_8.518076_19_plen_479_part_00
MLEGWRNLRLLFPNATLVASSLEAFTAEAWVVRGKMPRVTDELGDTWIRGTGADPTKGRRYRVVARALARAVESGVLPRTDARLAEAYGQLIKLPEHTYGSNDGRVAGLPWDNAYLDAHMHDAAFQATSAGYMDQRAYIDRAVAALGSHPLRGEVERALQESEPAPLSAPPPGLVPWPLGAGGAPAGHTKCGGVTLGIDAAGAVAHLADQSGRQWATANRTLARFRYRSHSEPEFNAYGDRYMLPGCRSKENPGLCGFGKQGLTSKAGAVNKDWMPHVTAAWRGVAGAAHCKLVIQLGFPAEAQSKYGAPSVANISISSVAAAEGSQSKATALMIDVHYHKRHTRMAESLWLSFAPLVASPHGWRLDKLRQAIDPFAVVANGSRAMHAIWDGISYHEPAPARGHTALHSLPHEAAQLRVQSLDAAIVAIDEPSPIVFLRDEQIRGSAFHFNLFNNAWNVNYPVWEVNTDERFRFVVTV